MLKIQQHRLLLQRSTLALCISFCLGLSASFIPVSIAHAAPAHQQTTKQKRVIIFVWDGLRPDSVTETLTPNLARLQNEQGVHFTDHHSVYPTFTMMNAAALATGSYPGHHGFFGNTEYQPGVTGKNAKGKTVDFSQLFLPRIIRFCVIWMPSIWGVTMLICFWFPRCFNRLTGLV